MSKTYCALGILSCLLIVSNVNATESDNVNADEYAKIAVSVSESINSLNNKNMSACENAIEKVLTDAKCNIVHNKYIEGLSDTKTFDSLMIANDAAIGDKTSSNEVGSESNEIAAIPTTVKRGVKADILIIGEVNADNLSEEPTVQTSTVGIYSARASGHFKVLWVEDGNIITSFSEAASGADTTKSMAASKALSGLGEQAGNSILKSLYKLNE